ncbi:putative cytosolic leucyl aminopeptidase, putative,metallo-peptidase, Clan MF, Family M17 [Trypanosoma rangeli]|uniref:Putative cytosolic leucyl aminopeptidase, putative,metallo-peptidase, Clan MF, Family M17 n=1 Tax=Trypanosoma rangeli TaxID=5698 RepID=A0A3R7MFB6_TRYRA|nr:putative cytosolic leucyl aminopeptidase, putative,metallo-peptidase, Clan MF, Family M17 [Trypanosoma rangeli]RNF01476.1 putative cytosolic leucyl aminopeptidase, putative,metallo-peptidase, Clan MF, Family M17 [Trypanosoma rangeli]|eukprot:RNF01476.1 putative cytosolic leucyl aminopeptidase, putative,metallo-peptidase, Clan MF, Family M17 [Trypanosoma rangeli]
MLKRVASRAPFPVSLEALPWSSRGAERVNGKLKKSGTVGANDDRMLSVEFAAPEQAAEGLPFGFKNEAGRVALDSERRCLFAGLGTKPTVCDYRLAVTNAVREAQKLQASALVLKSLPNSVHSMGDLFQEPGVLPLEDVVEKTAAFAVTAAYKYDRLRSKQAGEESGKTPMGLFIDSESIDAIARGNVIGGCVNEARNLGNLREDEGIPQLYAEWIARELAPLGVKVRHVLKGERLRSAGLNLLYNVGKGSRHEPYLVVFEYTGNRYSEEATALVGKGVTFDCGGLNVKPYGSMETMHLDMMGAATVISTIKAIALLRLPVNVVGAVGLVENAIGPDSYFPSSIITSRKGLTVEVLNTDAEGRLVLADTLTFVQRDAKLTKRPNSVIDLATLTGAVLIGLGSRRAGMFSNDLHLARQLMAGGRSSGDELWPMPIAEEHKKAVKGGLADLTNVSTSREAGSCTAAAFLGNFIEDGVKWAHLDIAGVAMGGDKPKGFQPAGAPGFGVQMLLDYFRLPLADGTAATDAAAPAAVIDSSTSQKSAASKEESVGEPALLTDAEEPRRRKQNRRPAPTRKSVKVSQQRQSAGRRKQLSIKGRIPTKQKKEKVMKHNKSEG